MRRTVVYVDADEAERLEKIGFKPKRRLNLFFGHEYDEAFFVTMTLAERDEFEFHRMVRTKKLRRPAADTRRTHAIVQHARRVARVDRSLFEPGGNGSVRVAPVERTIDALLATPEWRGARVEREPGRVVLRLDGVRARCVLTIAGRP